MDADFELDGEGLFDGEEKKGLGDTESFDDFIDFDDIDKGLSEEAGDSDNDSDENSDESGEKTDITEEDLYNMTEEELEKLVGKRIRPDDEFEHIVNKKSTHEQSEESLEDSDEDTEEINGESDEDTSEKDFRFEPLDSVIGNTDEHGADHDGSILDQDALLKTDNFDTVDTHSDFISEDGSIVVMDESEKGDNFKFQYVDIENIAIVKRIRKNTTNVDDLVQSIKSTGLLEPLVVAPTATEGFYVLLAGFRRILACAKAGKRRIPCNINIKANTPEIPVLEALYNHSKKYNIKEIIDYIDYLEKQKGIMSASMIEYLLQLNSGDYTKLKDILNDNDEDIVSKLFDGTYTIETAFKKLEQRRKKESAEEKENKKAARVYEDEEESGASNIAGSGDEADSEGLSEEEIKSLAISASDLDNVGEENLEDLVEEGENIEGFKPHKQDYKERERLDPALRKAVLARDNNTCQICEIISGQEFTEVLDVHHIIEVYLGGNDHIDNLITACTVCHKLIHLYGRGELHIRPISELSEQEQNRFKKIVKLGTVIRKGMVAKGMKKEQLKKADKAETIGRTKPGTERQVAT